MDANSQNIKQKIHLLKQQQKEIEDNLQRLRREQNEQVWLVEDVARVHVEERESLNFLQEVWQGAESRSFGYFLEDVQDKEQQMWHKKSKQTKKNANKRLLPLKKAYIN